MSYFNRFISVDFETTHNKKNKIKNKKQTIESESE